MIGFLCLELLQTFRLLFRFLYSRFLVNCYLEHVILSEPEHSDSSRKITTPLIHTCRVSTASSNNNAPGGYYASYENYNEKVARPNKNIKSDDSRLFGIVVSKPHYHAKSRGFDPLLNPIIFSMSIGS